MQIMICGTYCIHCPQCYDPLQQVISLLPLIASAIAAGGVQSAVRGLGQHVLLRKRSTEPMLSAELSELEQYDRMLTWMITTYFMCLAFGWGLLAFDYLVIRVEKKTKDEPWMSDAIIIGGAAAVLSPIIQWSNTIVQTRATVGLPDILQRKGQGSCAFSKDSSAGPKKAPWLSGFFTAFGNR